MAKREIERAKKLLTAANGMTTDEAVRWLKGEIFGFNSQQLTHILTLAGRLGYPETVRYLEHGPEMVEDLKYRCSVCGHSAGAKCDSSNRGSCSTWNLLAKLEGK
jgi:hypothetical protein